MEAIEGELSGGTAVARAGDSCSYSDWAGRLLGARGDIERVQAMHEIVVLLRGRFDVHRVRARIDRGSAGDADLRHEVGAGCVAEAVDGGGAHFGAVSCVDQAGMPKRIGVRAGI